MKRKTTGPLQYHAIDDAARNGAFHCVRDMHGHQHCAHWHDGAWRYGSGQPLDTPPTEYLARRALEAWK
jgi:hypothetical protein